MSFTRFPFRFLVIVLIVALANLLPIEIQADKSGQLTVYSNPTSIAINSVSSSAAPIPATVYPSTIDVSGMTGTVTRVSVTVKGLSHQNIQDVDLLLVSPTGAKFIFMADVGSSGSPPQDKVLTFADDAPSTVPFSGEIASGSYRPTNGDLGTDTFPAPAPAGPYNQPPAATFASTFNGASPNGTWSLFAVDDTSVGTAGSIHSGWSITVTTDAAPATFANSSYIGIHDTIMPSTPYGTPINVSGAAGVVSNLKLTLTGFSHPRPQDVDVLLVSPNGEGVIVMSDAGGTSAANNLNITLDDSAVTTLPIPLASGSFRPTDNFGADFFPGPAPLGPYHAGTGSNQLSNFNGFSPNGEWRLFVVDSLVGSSGSISGGWSLDITTTPVMPPPATGCGAPSFTTSSFATGTLPTNLAVADFNNDSKHDLAVTNQISNTVSILLGNGNGTFAPQTQLAVGSSPYALAAGRFNADSNFDLAVVNSGSNTVSILLGNGNGTFGAPTSINVGPSPISTAAGDLNNDSNLDLAVANFGSFFSGTVAILLGNGSGGFTLASTIRTRTQPSFVAIANLNQSDTNRDLVVTTFGSDSVSTFFGNGNGTFTLSQNLNTGAGPVSVDVTELGFADGVADLIVANYNGDSITTFTGAANGTFSSGGTTPLGGPNPISIAVNDYTGGGIRDAAVALSGTNLVKVGATNITVGANPNSVESVDLNGDGKPDLVSVNSGSNDVTVMLNNCTVAAGNIFDWDGDRRTDYVIYRPSTQYWYNTSLSTSNPVKNFSRQGDQIVPADYDGDSRTDYAFYRPENGLWVVQTATSPIYFLQFGLPDDIPSPADFDGDGKADISVFRPSDGNWYIRRSSDNSVEVVHFGGAGDKPVQADFDGDRKADVAVFRPSNSVWYVLRSSDAQVFILQFGISEDKTVVGDYDGDSKADIAIWRPSTSDWWIRRSSDGVVVAYPWGAPGDIPVVGDYDRDGRFDPAVWRPSDRTWYVLRSSDNGVIYQLWGTSGDFPVPNAFVR